VAQLKSNTTANLHALKAIAVRSDALDPLGGAPNFFLVGAPKAGTTSLYHYLDQHPAIYMSPIKEPHYLANEIRLENFTDKIRARTEERLPALRRYLEGPMSEKFSGGPVSEWKDYLKLFHRVYRETAIGEASVCYLWSRTAPFNIAARFPDSRILIMLRDPVERAYSQYLHALSFTRSYVPFRSHIDRALAYTGAKFTDVYPFLQFGLYYEQVKRYFELFPRERVHICYYEDYVRAPLGTIQAIYRFLPVDDRFVPDLSQRHMQASVPRSWETNRWLKATGLWSAARNLSPPPLRRWLKRVVFRPRRSMALEPADRALLIDFYREDIHRLETLLNRDLSAWLDHACVGAASR
jgi:Sulfotransferase family